MDVRNCCMDYREPEKCNFLIVEHRGKPYALIAHVWFE